MERKIKMIRNIIFDLGNVIINYNQILRAAELLFKHNRERGRLQAEKVQITQLRLIATKDNCQIRAQSRRGSG